MPALYQDVRVIPAIDVLPDVLNYLWNSKGSRSWRLNFESRDVFEITEESPVETIENGKLLLINIVTPARSTSEHLFPENPGFDRSQEDNEFQLGNVDAS